MKEVTLVIGRIGSGKSEETLRQLKEEKIRNTIIFDINRDPIYAEYILISHDQVASFLMQDNGTIGRIEPYIGEKRMSIDETALMVNKLLITVKHGVLFLEDIAFYANPQLLGTLELKDKSYQKDKLSVICIFTSINSIPLQLLKDANIIRLHKLIDNIDKFKDKVPNFEILKVAEILLAKKTRKKRYFNCTIQQWKYLDGDFSKREYIDAHLEYLIRYKGLNHYLAKVYLALILAISWLMKKAALAEQKLLKTRYF